MSGKDVLENQVKMFYNTSKNNKWVQIKDKKGSDNGLLKYGYWGYKEWIPAVAAVEKGLEGLEKFFDWTDAKKGNKVYPRYVVKGHNFFIPIDVVMSEINLSGFSGKYVDGVKFVIPTNSHKKSKLFVKFRVGQYSAVPTSSKIIGVEVLGNRSNPMIYSQRKGNLSLERDVQKNLPSDIVKGWFKAYKEGDIAYWLDHYEGRALTNLKNEMSGGRGGYEAKKAMMKRGKKLSLHDFVVRVGLIDNDEKRYIDSMIKSKGLDKNDFARADILFYKNGRRKEGSFYLMNIDKKWFIYSIK